MTKPHGLVVHNENFDFYAIKNGLLFIFFPTILD